MTSIPSLICLGIASTLLIGDRVAASGRTRVVAITLPLLVLLLAAAAFPISPRDVRMGDFKTYTQSRDDFDEYTLHRDSDARFSSHLAFHALWQVDRVLGATEQTPPQAFVALSWLAGLVFVVSGVAFLGMEWWASSAVRYVALAVAAPATLMFFGYRELGHLSIFAMAFPLVARGVAAPGVDLSPSLMAGAFLYGIGAAMHGSGLVGIAGICAAIMMSGLP